MSRRSSSRRKHVVHQESSLSAPPYARASRVDKPNDASRSTSQTTPDIHADELPVADLAGERPQPDMHVVRDSDLPELVFGLVGPIGVDIDSVQKRLESALATVQYKTIVINITESISSLLSLAGQSANDAHTLEQKIENGNTVRRIYGDKAILAADAIDRIQRQRIVESRARGLSGDDKALAQKPVGRLAYIVRQLKREEEIDLLASCYGKQFVQISISATFEVRRDRLKNRMRIESKDSSEDETDWEVAALKLIRKDQSEKDVEEGQRVVDIFPKGDFFIESGNVDEIKDSVDRFVEAFFGSNRIAPTKDEFGSFFAKAAALRSVDAARQVGAAIFTREGDLVSVGCNDAPKPGGGGYWDEDGVKRREVDGGGEYSRQENTRIIQEFLTKLEDLELLPRGAATATMADVSRLSKLRKSAVGRITEFHRSVHAEMNALMDAARLGRSVENCTIYVTTFPCHNCAKHIIASGIERIVYIEPYPKSHARLIYPDAFTDVEPNGEESGGSEVVLRHFSGIVPRRFPDIFEKEDRRDDAGEIQEWAAGRPRPMLTGPLLNYNQNEAIALQRLVAAKEKVVGSKPKPS